MMKGPLPALTLLGSTVGYCCEGVAAWNSLGGWSPTPLPCHPWERSEGIVKISLKAIILIVFAVIVSLALMIAVWRIIGKLEVDDHDHSPNDDNSL